MSSRVTVRGKRPEIPKNQKVSITVGLHESEGSQPKKFVEGEFGTDETLVEAMSKHEFGVTVPRRSWLADWFDQNETELRENVRKIVTTVTQRHQPVEVAAKRFGAYCVGQIQQRIADGIEPELSEARKREKEELTGSAKDTPLIFTGQFRSSIRSRVEAGTTG